MDQTSARPTQAPTSGFMVFSQGGSQVLPTTNGGHGLQVTPSAHELVRDDSASTLRQSSVQSGQRLLAASDDSSDEGLKRRGSRSTNTSVISAARGKNTSSPMDYAMAHIGPMATSQALIKFASGTTLLPQNIASLITSLSLLARVSLRATAFFVEVILEAARFSTSTSLGLTRRALISAIGSARSLHAIKDADGGAWDPQSAGQITDGREGAGTPSTVSKYVQMRGQAYHDGFLAVLDKYTAVGIYVIHHTFTMAELFAMSSFYLVDTSIKAGLSAADESVRMIDGIFGSNETSRALSSFITLVRRELNPDGAEEKGKGGTVQGIKTLASLTKAITAFAVLQNATYKRTAQEHKTKVLYDCTLLGQVENDSWRSMIVGSGNFVKKVPVGQAAPVPPRSSSSALPSSSSHLPQSSRSTTIPASGSRLRNSQDVPGMRNSRSHYGGDALCLTDLGSDLRYEVEDFDDVQPRSSSSSIVPPDSSDRDEQEIVADLQYLIGSDDEDEVFRRVPKNQPSSSSGPLVRRTIQRQNPENGTIETVYEEVTETTETIETTTYTKSGPERISSKTARFSNPFGPLIPSRGKSRNTSQSSVPSSPQEGWTEIMSDSAMPSPRESSDDDMLVERELIGGTIPQMPNGLPSQNAGTIARREALERPEESKARMQVVLRTITRKLVQKKKIIQTRQSGGNTITSTSEFQNFQDDVFSENTSSGADSPPRKQRIQSVLGARAGNGSPTGESSRQRGPKALQNLFSRNAKQARRQGSDATMLKAPLSSALASDELTPPSSPPPRGDRLPQMSVSPVSPEKRLPAIPQGTPSLRSRLTLGRTTEEDRGGKRRARAQSITSLRSFVSNRRETHTTTNTATADVRRFAIDQFPRQHFVKNLHTFMRYSSAAYGQNFMRIFGIGGAEYLFADTSRHHSNVWNFAHHVGVPIDNVLLSSYTQGESAFHSEKMAPLVNYVAVDDVNKAVVLACRGSLGLSDILTDLTCDYEPISVHGGGPTQSYYVHSGMLASAIRLKDEKSTIHETLRKALERHPDYGLVLTGHSLGGGVAALLAILWGCPVNVFQQQLAQKPSPIVHPPLTTQFVTSLSSGLPAGRPIHAYAYGVPAIGSADLSKYGQGLVTSLVHGHDLVPSLSLGTLRDMLHVAETLGDERESTMAQEIVGAVVGLYQRKRKAAATQRGPLSKDDINFPRPSEPPASEREVQADQSEISQGKTKNRALEAGYTDPVLKEDMITSNAGQVVDAESNTKDWLWSLVKTMRASMGEEKLYPPGDVFCIESFDCYVTPRTSQSESSSASGQEGRTGSSSSEAHRVILRQCVDVEKRFSEPVFARSMLRDHIPTNYELCTQLLFESVLGDGA